MCINMQGPGCTGNQKYWTFCGAISEPCPTFHPELDNSMANKNVI